MSAYINTPVTNRQLDAERPINGSTLLSTPRAIAKAVAGTPWRYAVVGDSMCTGFDLGPNIAKRGYIGLAVPASLKTGTVSDYGGSVEGDPAADYDSFVNGTFQRFAVSSSGEFVANGNTGISGYTQGNKAAIAYIARPGAGTFRLRSKTPDGTFATLAASIDATKDGAGNTVSEPTGVVKEYDLSTTGYPAFRLVVDTVATGAVDIVFGAVFPTTGGGAIETRVLAFSRGGLEISDSLQTPAAIIDPIWEWLEPDVVFSLWADEAPNWESGGNWRTYYSQLKAAYADTDFVQISRNPSSGEDALCAAQVAAQRAWAEEENECFIDVQSLVGGTYEAANDEGLMSDTVHMSTTGTTLRNAHIWKLLQLGQLELGAWGPSRAFQLLAEPTASPAYGFTYTIRFASGWQIPDSGATSTNLLWHAVSANKVLSFYRGTGGSTQEWYQLSAAQDGTAGFYPAAGLSGVRLGKSDVRWSGFFTTANLSSYIEGTEETAPSAPSSNGYRIYAEDNGSGKTRLMVKFATGAAQQIAIEP